MLRDLTLRNFKSWRRFKDLRFAPITGIFGPNSSGKSSILQYLLLLKQTAQSTARTRPLDLGGDDASLVSLGSFRDVLFAHDTDGELAWTLYWRLPQRIRVTDPENPKRDLFSGDELALQAVVRETDHQMYVSQFGYRFGDHRFGMTRVSSGEYDLVAEGSDFAFRRNPGRPWPLPDPVKCYGFPDQVRAYFKNAGFLAKFEFAFEQMASRSRLCWPAVKVGLSSLEGGDGGVRRFPSTRLWPVGSEILAW